MHIIVNNSQKRQKTVKKWLKTAKLVKTARFNSIQSIYFINRCVHGAIIKQMDGKHSCSKLINGGHLSRSNIYIKYFWYILFFKMGGVGGGWEGLRFKIQKVLE